MANKSNSHFSIENVINSIYTSKNRTPTLILWSKLPDSIDFISIEQLKNICYKAHVNFAPNSLVHYLLHAFDEEYRWENLYHDHNDVDAREFITNFLLDHDPGLTYTFREMYKYNPNLTLDDVNIMSIYRTGVNLYYRPYAIDQITSFVQQNFYLFDQINEQIRLDLLTNNSTNEHNT